MNLRNRLFVVISLIIGIIYYTPIRELLMLSLYDNELYSHIVIIPLVSAYFIYLKRKEIFSYPEYSVSVGIGIIIIGSLFYLAGLSQVNKLTQNDYLTIMTFAAVLTGLGVFVLCYGVKTFKIAAFPLLFLFFIVPVPGIIMENVINALQSASTEVVFLLFKLTGVSFIREEFVFHLPGLSIEVAPQCSGIRSSLSLFITSIIAGQIFLDSNWKRVALSLAVFPITVFKNGLRIFTLSVLGVYVDESILASDLHKRGGIPFFLLSLVFLGGMLWLLRRFAKNDIRA